VASLPLETTNGTEQAWIRRTDDGRRLLVLGADLFDAIRRDLGGIFSDTFAANLLYRIGISLGRTSYLAARNRIATEKDFWQVLEEHLKERGFAKLVGHETSAEGSKLRVEVSLHDSVFAENVTSRKPLCDVLRGALGEWASLHYGRKLLSSSESACNTSGSEYCIFLVELGSEMNQE